MSVRVRTDDRPPAKNAGRSTRAHRRIRAAVLADSDVCHLCGHPGAGEADHVISIDVDPSLAEDPDNYRPAHGTSSPCPTCGRQCNQNKGAKPALASLGTTIDWYADPPETDP